MAGMKNHYSYLESQWVNGSYCVVFILAQIQHSIYSVLLQLGKELEKSGYKLWCQTLLRLWTLYSSQNLKKGSLVLFKTRVCEKTKKQQQLEMQIHVTKQRHVGLKVFKKVKLTHLSGFLVCISKDSKLLVKLFDTCHIDGSVRRNESTLCHNLDKKVWEADLGLGSAPSLALKLRGFERNINFLGEEI